MKKEISYIEISKQNQEDIFQDLESSDRGLAKKDIQNRINLYGDNNLKHLTKTPLIVKFLSKFTDPITLTLLFATIIAYIMGEALNAIIIGVILLVGVLLDFYQEYSADKSLSKLLASIKSESKVIRDDVLIKVEVSNIVIGDVLVLSAGDLIPADARIIEADDFFVNQSAITGESFPVQKINTINSQNSTSLLDLENIIFRGTNVISGSAKAIVFKTGVNTEFGKIAKTLYKDNEKSDFEMNINKFGHFLMKIVFVLVVFIFIINALFKNDLLESFMFAIAIAVGVTPEFLPVILSVTMTAGSIKMSKKGVIVKTLSTIPNLGTMNIFCTDKTGTLTQDKISLVKYTDSFGNEDEGIYKLSYINSYFQKGIANPLDDAILKFKKINIKGYHKVDEIPYDFFRKMLTIIVKKDDDNLLVTKGAPENVLEKCKFIRKEGKILKLTKLEKEKAISTYHSLSEEGYRVLMVGTKEIKSDKIYNKKDESNLIMEGFVAFLDLPKTDVKKVIGEMQKLGVEIKIITGDNHLVTRKICSEVNLDIKGIMTGSDLKSLTDDALKIKVEQNTIFARCSPDEKNRIINALRSNQNIVGYMGDGINDAPSLKTADVGISVNSGVDIAKESADIILLNKSLEAVVDGIKEGRRTFANTMKYLMMILSSNLGNMVSAASAAVFLPFLPMLPTQVVLNDLLYDMSQLSISSDNVDSDWVDKPRKWDLNFIKKFMFTFGPVSSIFDITTFVILYFILGVGESTFQTAWFMQSVATQTFVIHIIRTKKIPFIQSRPSKLMLVSSIIFVTLGWIIPYTGLFRFMGLNPVPLNITLILVGTTFIYLVLVHIVKNIFYSKVKF